MSYTAGSFTAGEQPTTSKWNQLWSNDASFADGTGISDSAILPKHLLTGTGSSWAWATYVPTWTNVSGGTFNYAQYTQIGKTVFVRFKYTLAGAGISGEPILSLPVTATANYNAANNGEILQGTVALIDAGVAYYIGMVMSNATTTVRIRAINGTPNVVGITSAIPFTWGNTDFIQASFMYEAA